MPDDERPTSATLAARPEARWALVAGIGGGLAAAALSVKAILGSTSVGAVLGFVFVPFVAIVAAVPAGIWGLALGCMWLHLRGRTQYFRAVLLLAWFVGLGVPSALGWEVWRGLSLQQAVRAVERMGPAELDAALERSRWRDDRFFLGALAAHPSAGAGLLDRIARIDDTALYEGMGSLWDVMGANRQGLAVMRLVAAHENVAPRTLERLANGAHADAVAVELARNPNTPINVLSRYFSTAREDVEAGLALNPHTPPNVLDRFAGSAYRATRINLGHNRATPRETLRRLSRDPDRLVARTASRALARMRGGG